MVHTELQVQNYEAVGHGSLKAIFEALEWKPKTIYAHVLQCSLREKLSDKLTCPDGHLLQGFHFLAPKL